jgi:hypothetical protein
VGCWWRDQVALEGRRDSDGRWVLIRASEIHGQKPSHEPKVALVRTGRETIAPGIATLAAGFGLLIVGTVMVGFGAADDPRSVLADAGYGTLAGSALLSSVGIALITVGARGFHAEVDAGQLRIELR